MPREAIVLQVFVASPADVSVERELLETVVKQLNQIWGKSLGIMFDLLKWESHVHPTFSSDPQSAINEQIGHDYDVFIGIFWSRIGTDTPRARSGTIEEFDRAYERFRANHCSPEIMLYFKDAPISPSKIDAKQLQEVQDFRASLSSKGGLYSVFEDQTGFESSLRAHLSAIAQKFFSQRKTALPDTLQTKMPMIATTALADDDYGYIDYIEIYEDRMAEMQSAISSISEATVRLGEQLTNRALELKGETPGDTKTLKRFIKRAADDMNNYADAMSGHLVTLTASRKTAFYALTNALALQGNIENKNGLKSLATTLSLLILNATSAKSGMLVMRTAADELPRISKDLNSARRTVTAQLDGFLAEIENTESTVHNIVEAIDRMLAS